MSVIPEKRDDEDRGSRVRSREALVLRVRREEAALRAEHDGASSPRYTVLGFAEPDAVRLRLAPELLASDFVDLSREAPAFPGDDALTEAHASSRAAPPGPVSRTPAQRSPAATASAVTDLAAEPLPVPLELMAAHAARVDTRQRRAARQSKTRTAGTGAAIAVVLAGGVAFSALSSFDEGTVSDITPVASSISESLGLGAIGAQRAADRRSQIRADARRQAQLRARARKSRPATRTDAQPAVAAPPKKQQPSGASKPKKRRSPSSGNQAPAAPAPAPTAQAPRPQPQASQQSPPKVTQKPTTTAPAPTTTTPGPTTTTPVRPAPSGGGDPSLGSGPGL
jgi:hypothetical protein